MPLGPQLDDLGFDRQRSRELLGEVGFFTRVACSMQGLTYSRRFEGRFFGFFPEMEVPSPNGWFIYVYFMEDPI